MLRTRWTGIIPRQKIIGRISSRKDYFSSQISQTSKKAISRDPSSIRFTVGYMETVEPHPDADSLYVSSVRLKGDDKRIVCTGLVGKVEIAELVEKQFVFVTNLKPMTLKGITSHAMLLAGENEQNGKVEPVRPPDNSQAGDDLQFGGFRVTESKRLVKSSIWKAVSKNMTIDDTGSVVYTSTDGKLSHLFKRSLLSDLDTTDLLKDQLNAYVPTLRSGIVR